MTEKKNHVNRLISQKSPYLQQHAHNPVNWYPWGNEAFEESRRLSKPIFLSIGYATCHWCHVMERESFENQEIADLMNDTFINIKIDREELPEVDSLYMGFAQSSMGGAAGWPLNLLLTPGLIPFFAATYLPPKNAHGLMGLSELIVRVKEMWNSEERDEIVARTEEVFEVFNRSIHTRGDAPPGSGIVSEVAELLFQSADPVHGGLRGAPKFPIGYQYIFLLRFFCLKNENRALFVVEKTLDMMHRGGIYDHLGGGFSRYSVDEEWLVPHFEKMLYDNALLAQAYLEAWKITKNEFYKNVCREILDYILRDMTHPGGGFYSAEDADSEGHEGFFYTWTYNDVISLLGRAESTEFCDFYGITEAGNFEGRNILHTRQNIEEFAKSNTLDLEILRSQFAAQRKILWDARKKRPRPFKDDKILSSWNGLMIASFALAGAVFSEEKYLRASVKAAEFVEEHMVKNGRLLRRWREGEACFNAGIDEYAYLIRAYITLFEVGCGSVWLQKAINFSEILKQEFKVEGGAFYQTDGSDSSIIMRKCQFADGAEPSGNAVHTENLLKLSSLTGDSSYLVQAEDVIKALRKYVENYPLGYCYHAMNLLSYYDKQDATIIIALNDQKKYLHELTHLIFQRVVPPRSVVWLEPHDATLLSIAPYLKEYKPLEGETSLYLCSNGACKEPVNNLKKMEEALAH